MRSFVLDSGPARVEVDLDHGGRLASLVVGGRELLARAGPSPIEWGCYPMAPWAGRVRRGRFTFAGEDHQMPADFGGHAIHGTVLTRRWEREGERSVVCELGPPWPFAGFVRQTFDLGTDRLELGLEVHATGGGMPASCGWHPWFRRDLGDGPVRLDFDPGYMLRRDPDGITTTERVEPVPPPWDDCFGDVASPPVLQWPGSVRLTMEADCAFWVVYSERAPAICVEPQTAPPDALNHDPFIVRKGAPLLATTSWSWNH